MLKTTASLVAALLLSNTSAQPPTEGKFFYADFEDYEHPGLHKVTLNIENK